MKCPKINLKTFFKKIMPTCCIKEPKEEEKKVHLSVQMWGYLQPYRPGQSYVHPSLNGDVTICGQERKFTTEYPLIISVDPCIYNRFIPNPPNSITTGCLYDNSKTISVLNLDSDSFEIYKG